MNRIASLGKNVDSDVENDDGIYLRIDYLWCITIHISNKLVHNLSIKKTNQNIPENHTFNGKKYTT